MKPIKKKQNSFSYADDPIEARDHLPTLRALISKIPRKTQAYFMISGYSFVFLFIPVLVVIANNYIALQLDPLIEEKQKLDTSLEIFKTLISGAGTLATIVGGIFLYLNFKIATKNTELAESRLITERFSKAVEQLGDKERQAVRLGGIYSLERIAKNSPDYHWTVIEVLASFVRDKLPTYDRSIDPKISTEVQAILDVITRRNTATETEQHIINLCDANLKGANFQEAKLSRIHFMEANLCNSNFIDAELRDMALSAGKLERADLSRAKLFTVNLNYARMVSTCFYRSEIVSSLLDNANFSKSSFVKAEMKVIFARKADFTEADFTQSSLLGCDFSGAKFEGAKFEKTDIKGSIFLKAQNLTVEQVFNTLNHESAYYDPDFREALGLPPDTRNIPVDVFGKMLEDLGLQPIIY